MLPVIDLLRKELITSPHRIEITETEDCRYTIQSHPSQPKPVSDDKEPLIQDLLYIHSLQKGPFTLGLPQITRDIKRAIRKLWK